jgi:hypothetical protein
MIEVVLIMRENLQQVFVGVQVPFFVGGPDRGDAQLQYNLTF